MQSQSTFLSQAERLTESVQNRFWEPDKRQYAAFVTEADARAPEPAFAWDMAVQLSALAAAMHSDRNAYQPLFDRSQASLDSYGASYKNVFGYAVLPNQKKPDRYYDDNEWIALAQLDAYDATHQAKYLDLAKRTFEFVMSGYSDDLGGGLFWREREKKSKNTCSNAPAMLAAARLYMATRVRRYLDIAVDLQKWVERLKDLDDNLMFDNITLDGKIQTTKWTYNSALMIRGDLALYGATGSRKYMEEAVAIGKSSITHWVDPSTGALRDEGPFAHHLAEAFLALARFDQSEHWKQVAERAIQFAQQNSGRDGLFGLRWDKFQVRDGRFFLLYQGSMARALWMAAESR